MEFCWKWHRHQYIEDYASSFHNFDEVAEKHAYTEPDAKNATLKVSSSVVSIITQTGSGEEGLLFADSGFLFAGSGTIIEYDQQSGIATILTSATLLCGCKGAPTASIPSNLNIEVYLSDGKLYKGELMLYDFYYNIATVTIKSTTHLSVATFCYVDDFFPIDLSNPVPLEYSNKFKLFPGERLIALGRSLLGAREVMASPGVFSAFDCDHDCKELLLTTCVVTMLAVGGPLINYNGEVIGINFFKSPFNAFVPINIVSKCLEDLKKHGQVARPWLGMSISNLYLADLEKLEKLYQKFPSISSGVMVKQVIGFWNKSKVPRISRSPRNFIWTKAILQNKCQHKGMDLITTNKLRKMKWPKSPAHVAGLCVGDVVIKCGGVSVRSHLEFVEALWDKEGRTVELEFIRPSIGLQTVTLTVGTCPKMRRWCALCC